MTAMRSSGAGLTMTLRARRERVLVIAERADTNAYATDLRSDFRLGLETKRLSDAPVNWEL